LWVRVSPHRRDPISKEEEAAMKLVDGANQAVWKQGISKTVCALTLTLFLLSPEATHALIIDSFYVESASDFTWRFTWNGVAGPIAFSIDSVNPAVPNAVFWGAPPQVGGAAGPAGGFINLAAFQRGQILPGNDLSLAVQHKIGPHGGIDIDPGVPATFLVPNADFAAPAGPGFVQIGGAVAVAHAPHFDEYSLSYRNVFGGGTEFEFTGHHVIPEPATLLLFGTTMAGLGLARWRQRRRRQQAITGAE
jgi:hypothetical protein